jgi:hypothetical protein
MKTNVRNLGSPLTQKPNSICLSELALECNLCLRVKFKPYKWMNIKLYNSFII